MRVQLCSILLNEEEWLERHYAQHKNWPGLINWTFVEGADVNYGAANPGMTTPDGLSVDRTSSLLHRIASTDPRVSVIQHGWMRHSLPDQSKCEGRNRYLDNASNFKPDILITTDIDEFYTREDQQRINDICASRIYYGSEGASTQWDSWMFRQRHIWHPPGLNEYDMAGETTNPLFSQEVVGGYWQVPHTRVWRYIPGMRHVRNHNWPEVNGRYLTEKMLRCDLMPEGFGMNRIPECVHLGYASSSRSRKAKHAYYKARGEGQEGGRLGRKRSMYLDCRDAYEKWVPGASLPHGASVIEYNGPIPEVFQ